jgi:hypothetical protein
MRTVFFCLAMAIASLTFATELCGQSLDDNEHYRAFKSWAINTQEPDPLPNMFKFCIASYDKMLASGVSPSTRVPEQVMEASGKFPRIEWKGTVQELKEKWCEAGGKKVADDVAARHAPYKAALKADKLRLVIDQTHGGVSSYALAGGKYTSDPKALAAARVWFLDIGRATNDTRFCVNGGKLSSVRRYTFDANHKLLGTTEKEYCGTPPASAYR